ncbi:nuclease-related domain-containing protein [Bacillus sp. T33-2]|uniref:nuclease-related domain-containing protein n=1 Tax=Bacillus sp. T33-2 TaxID=2054168 RepID=UPI0026A56D0D|nr:nuclease-related domain-containing protein [Bacillus sp. T33-2]
MSQKLRAESVELRTLGYLNNRMDLPEKSKQYYIHLKKGFEGEVMFDSFTQKLQCDCIIINDLLIQINSTTFQVDTLLMLPDTIYLFEVKNYEGDYYYESDRINKKPKFEISNPLTQLSRCESLLRQLLNSLDYKINIDASVVFINPQFTLYQAPLDMPFIFPSQINCFFKKVNTTPGKLN